MRKSGERINQTRAFLEAVRDLTYPSKIAKALNITRPAVTQRAKNNPYVKTTRKGRLCEYALTPAGKQYLNSQPLGNPHNLNNSTIPLIQEAIKKRPHDLQLTFKLKDPLGPHDPPAIALRSGVRYEPVEFGGNHTDAILLDFRLKARLYPSAIVVYVPEAIVPISSSLQQAMNNLFAYVEETIWQIEERMGVKTKKLDKKTLIGLLTNQHIALMNHPFAEWLRKNRLKIEVPDPDGGEPLLTFDYSHGKDELESENVLKGEKVIDGFTDLTLAFSRDALRVDDLTALPGLVKDLAAFQARQAEQQARQAQEIQKYAEASSIATLFFTTHTDAIAEMRDYFKLKNEQARNREERKKARIARDRDRTRKQKRLGEWV